VLFLPLCVDRIPPRPVPGYLRLVTGTRVLVGLHNSLNNSLLQGMLRSIQLLPTREILRAVAVSRRPVSSLLLDVAKEYIDTTKCKNQNDLAVALAAKLTSTAAFEAFRRVDRALFLPKNPAEYREPYANKPQTVGPVGANGATLSTPYHHALILSTLHEIGLKPGQTVLDVGCGSGWLTAAMFNTVGQNGGKVVAVDRVPELLEFAKRCLQECPVTAGAQGQNKIILADAYIGNPGENQTWNEAVVKSNGPYDIIHVGFAFDSRKDQKTVEWLTSLLKDTPEARVMAGWDHDLCLFDKKGFRKEVAHIPGMAVVERSTYQKPMSRAERLEQTKVQLDAWKALFEEKNKRKPTKDDLFKDPLAAELFKQFASLTKLA